jgi:hypothetical protein
MKILAISDFHGTIELLEPFSKRAEEICPDLIVFTGDIVKGYARGDEFIDALRTGRQPVRDKEEIQSEERQDWMFYHEFFTTLQDLKFPVVCVPGNMDAPEERYFQAIERYVIRSHNIKLIHGDFVNMGDYIISGFGGEITFSQEENFFVLQYSKQKVCMFLERINYFRGKKILLFHTPPRGDVIDLEGTQHRGCDVINELLSMIKPKIVFCGHAHKAQSKEKISDTLVVNPGALKNGKFAVIDTETEEVKFLKI